MSRFEGKIANSASARLSAAELLAMLGGEAGTGDAERKQAIACCLAAGEGWKAAAARLGGAFASEAGPAALRNGKAE